MKFRHLVCKVPIDQLENLLVWCLQILFPVVSRRYSKVGHKKNAVTFYETTQSQITCLFVWFFVCLFVFLSDRPNWFSEGICYVYLPNWPQYRGFCASWKLEKEINVLGKNNKGMWSACCWQILCDFSNTWRVTLEILLLVITSDICHASQENPWPSSEKFLTDLESSAIQTWSTCFIRYFFEQATLIALLSMKLKCIQRYWNLMGLFMVSDNYTWFHH